MVSFGAVEVQSPPSIKPWPSIVGNRCGLGLRLRAPTLFFSLALPPRAFLAPPRACSALARAVTLQNNRRHPLVPLPAFALLLCLALFTADSLSAGRRAGCRRRVGVPELPATGIAGAATPERFLLAQCCDSIRSWYGVTMV